MKRAVFLDRDGTIALDVPYCNREEDFHLFPETGEAVYLLNRAGFLVVVITNQSGIARGYLDRETLDAIHGYMCREIERQGGRVAAVYYCPHHPADDCACRKPRPGMLLKASRELDIDLKASFLVGDQETDVLAARAAGCRAALLNELLQAPSNKPDFCGNSLLGVVNWIIKEAESAIPGQGTS